MNFIHVVRVVHLLHLLKWKNTWKPTCAGQDVLSFVKLQKRARHTMLPFLQMLCLWLPPSHQREANICFAKDMWFGDDVNWNEEHVGWKPSVETPLLLFFLFKMTMSMQNWLVLHHLFSHATVTACVLSWQHHSFLCPVPLLAPASHQLAAVAAPFPHASQPHP